MNRDDDDGYGQEDGDESVGYAPASPFAKSMVAQPWLRGSTPPWHLWGTTQTVTTVLTATGARVGSTNQLLRINYKRPETWHFLFSARLISGPDNTATFFSTIDVNWELTTGIGRSALRMHFEPTPTWNGIIPPFERFRFQWGPVSTAFPVGAHIWSTQSQSPSRTFQGDGPFTVSVPVTEIVAQDIQLQAQVIGITIPANVAAAGQPVAVELTAHFAPKNHIRPDWFLQKQPIETQFPGDETGGT